MRFNMATYVIFGATGNLTLTKLIPAFYQLESEERLDDALKIIAIGRRDYALKDWHDIIYDAIHKQAQRGINQRTFETFSRKLVYFKMDVVATEDYSRLASFLDKHHYSKNIAYYLSMGPSYYEGIVKRLYKQSLLAEEMGWKRVVFEKPFGFDEASSKKLQEHLSTHLNEKQIFRIDHYLGKSMVQNIMVFRFANILMEPLWNNKYIDHIQITHSEDKAVGSRAGYYDGSGAMRDMIQSHLLQLLSLVTLEQPSSMDAEALRDEKVKLLRCVRSIKKDEIDKYTYRAQYTKGIIHNQAVKSYLEEDGVKRQSHTETYAALKLYIDNPRWEGVPFYLETGKNMKKRQTLISICFKHPDQTYFSTSDAEPNWIIFRVQPDEAIKIEMTAKQPGLEIEMEQLSLDTSLLPCGDDGINAYEDLLLDVLQGDRSLFLRFDEVNEAWKIVDPIIKHWSDNPSPIDSYTSGSWGPKGAEALFEKSEQSWRHNSELTPPKCKI